MSEADSSPKMSQLQEMSFHGNKVLLAFHPDGQVGVAPRRICENLEIVWRYQYEKFRRDPLWGMKSYHRQGDDPDVSLFLIPLQKVDPWLYTIHTSKLPGSPKEKLRLYKEGLLAAIDEFMRQRAARIAELEKSAPSQEPAEPQPDVGENSSDDTTPFDPDTAPEPDDVSQEASGVPVTLPDDAAPGPHASPFDQIREHDALGYPFWSARNLQPVLGYDTWRNFEEVVARAMVSCRNVGLNPAEHLTGASKIVYTSSGAQKELADFHLTRYGCYLVAMNGDPRKPEIAEAQQYFVVRTHQAETAERNGISNHDLMAALTRSHERHDHLLSVLTNGHVEMKQDVKQTQQDVKQTRQEAEEAQEAARVALKAASEAQEKLDFTQTRLEVQATMMEEQAARIAELEKSAPPPGHMTIANFARFKGMPDLELNVLKLWGANVSAECRYRGIEPIKVPVTGKKWRHVNSYPIELLEATFDELGPMVRGDYD